MTNSRGLRTIPTDAFCGQEPRTDAVAIAIANLEDKLRKEFDEKLKTSRSVNRSKIAALERSRVDNRAKIAALERGRAENRSRFTALENWRDRDIYLTRIRGLARAVELFFSAIYKTWVETSPRYGAESDHLSGWNSTTQLRNDFDRYPNPGDKGPKTRKDRISKYKNDKPMIEEANYRRARAIAFLGDMWTRFGGSRADIGAWSRLVRFVEATNLACHAPVSFGHDNDIENVVRRERGSPPRLDVEGVKNLMRTIKPMAIAFGNVAGGKWPRWLADETALAKRKLFLKFPGSGWPGQREK